MKTQPTVQGNSKPAKPAASQGVGAWNQPMASQPEPLRRSQPGSEEEVVAQHLHQHSPELLPCRPAGPAPRRSPLPLLWKGTWGRAAGVAHRRWVVPSCSGAHRPEDRVAESAVRLPGLERLACSRAAAESGGGSDARAESADACPVATCARACAERAPGRACVARAVPRACALAPPSRTGSAAALNVRACVCYLGLPRLQGKNWPPGPRKCKSKSITPPLHPPLRPFPFTKGEKRARAASGPRSETGP